MRRRIAVFIAVAALQCTIAAAADRDELRAAIAADYSANLRALFEHFHANPELSFRESATARRVASELRALGYEVTEGIGGTGVVAVLENGRGRTVLLRADMDGLPVLEQSGLPYASKARQVDADGIEQPVMHACGHDVHMTALIGAATQLAARTDEWSGTLVLIGQPAEERAGGARAMLADGLYERFPKPEYALAFHVAALQPAGTLNVPLAAAYSGADTVDIIVHGVGAHGASPHKGVDPVLVAAQIVVSLQSVVSRTIDPLQPGVITVGAIQGGSKHNIIGDRVDLKLTVRSESPATRTLLLDGIDRVAAGVAASLGVPQDRMPEVIRSTTETTPPTLNDTPSAERVRNAFLEHFGSGVLIDQPREGMGAEDFAYLVAPEHGVKGVYFSVGGTPAAEVASAASHHSPLFKIAPEPAVTAGAEAMVVGALTLLASD